MLNSKKLWLSIMLGVIFSLLFAVSCDDDDDGIADTEGTGTISMKLGDAPFPIDLVSRAEITIDRIALRGADEMEEDSLSYIILDEPQTYNLINFRNGLTADLPDVLVDAGSYDQVRLIISDAEIELTDGTTYDLKVPSGAASGLKIFIEPALQVNPNITYEVLLDFDLTKSFVVQGNPNTPAGINGFIFKPVIRAINLSDAGSIFGTVSDTTGNSLADVHIWVEQDSVISSTYTEIDGSYRIIGLPSGSYDVYALHEGFQIDSVENVSVTAGSDTEINFELAP